MSTPPTPQITVSQSGMLSRLVTALFLVLRVPARPRVQPSIGIIAQLRFAKALNRAMAAGRAVAEAEEVGLEPGAALLRLVRSAR
jgi:hypothetical protein